MFVVGNRFYSLHTQCRHRDNSAFCGISHKCHTNSLAAVENNSMRFCISLTRVKCILCNPRTLGQNTNIIRKHQVVQ